MFVFVLQPLPSLLQQQELMNEAIEKAKRAAELQARIQAQLANKPNLVRTVLHLINYFIVTKLSISARSQEFFLTSMSMSPSYFHQQPKENSAL